MFPNVPAEVVSDVTEPRAILRVLFPSYKQFVVVVVGVVGERPLNSRPRPSDLDIGLVVIRVEFWPPALQKTKDASTKGQALPIRHDGMRHPLESPRKDYYLLIWMASRSFQVPHTHITKMHITIGT